MLTNYDKERYKRHISLDNFTQDDQLKLKNAKILCIGAGGLGSSFLMYSVACGIGTIGILDMDNVELHNLSRQIIHMENKIGTSKVQSAKDTLLRMNSHTKINTYNFKVEDVKAINIFQEYDIIAVCVDNLSARYRINDLAIKYKKPQISSFVVGLDGAITCFKPYVDDFSPCYQCLHPQKSSNIVKTANEKGVLSPFVGLLGCAMVIEVLRELLNWENSLNGYLKYLSVVNHNTHMVKLSKRKDCICTLRK